MLEMAKISITFAWWVGMFVLVAGDPADRELQQRYGAYAGTIRNKFLRVVVYIPNEHEMNLVGVQTFFDEEFKILGITEDGSRHLILENFSGRQGYLQNKTVGFPTTFALNEAVVLRFISRENVKLGDLHVENLYIPSSLDLGPLKGVSHGVHASKVELLSTNQVKIYDFHYKDNKLTAFFWIGIGEKPDENGLLVPDETGGTESLGSYAGRDLVLTLRKGFSFYSFDYFGVYCENYKLSFGHVNIPKADADSNFILLPSYNRHFKNSNL